MQISYLRTGLTCIPFVGDLASLHYNQADLAQASEHRNALILTQGQETEAFQTFYENRRVYGLCNSTRYILQMAWCIHCLASNVFKSSIFGVLLVTVQSLYAVRNAFVVMESKNFFKTRMIELDEPSALRRYINPVIFA